MDRISEVLASEYGLKQISDNELAYKLGTEASKDFGVSYSTSFNDWQEDINTAQNNGVIIDKIISDVPNVTAYIRKCSLEVAEPQHIEIYNFYIAEYIDDVQDQTIGETYYI